MIVEPSTTHRSRSGRRPYKICAHLAWVLPIFSTAVAICVAVAGGSYHGVPIVPAIIAGVGILFGIVSGTVALLASARRGKRGIFAPALTGLFLCIGLLAVTCLLVVAMPAIHKTRARLLQSRVQPLRGGLKEAVRTPGAQRVDDAELGFSFDLPEGFNPIPVEKRSPANKYSYLKPGRSGNPAAIINIQDMHAVFPARHLIPDQLPPGKDLTLSKADWRGLAVDEVRLSEKIGQFTYVTLTVRIPLKKGGIQIGFGDLAENENLLQERVEKTLATLDGETNW